MACWLFAGCEHTNTAHFTEVPGKKVSPAAVTLTNQIDPAWLRPSPDLFTLGPGDRVEIEILGDPGSRVTTVVGPDGKIYYNLLSGIDVWGLTLGQTKARIEQGLAQFVREPPQVSVVLREVESKRIWVLGRVQGPGAFAIGAPITLLEAVSLAGGTLSLSSYRQAEGGGSSDDLADLKRSFVMRAGKPLPVDFQRLLQKGDLSQNIYLQADDLVYFPAANARQVYLLGAVAQPRALLYKEGMTAAAAVANGYGTLKGAYLEHVVVVRGSLSKPEAAVVDYRKVIRGMEQDVALQPGDIVYVPFSPYRYLTRYIQVAIDTFVSSVAINEGERLIGQPIGGANIFIPVSTGSPGLPAINPPPVR